MNLDELKGTLRGLVRKTIETRFSGANYASLAQARGYADGYMRALLDADLIDQRQLLDLVNTERRRFVDKANQVDETFAA
ncbi:MAG: hypothetical protein OEM15_03580 [Myxococcales bacterium]|nr:hypothetical protein [Myxococcales bacterium]MDH3485832.1 hypothetical protein [Myxococcales bacterium]